MFWSLEIRDWRVGRGLSEIRNQQPPGPMQPMDMFYLVSRVFKKVSFLKIEEKSTAHKTNYSTACSSVALTVSISLHAQDRSLVPNTFFGPEGNSSDSL